MTPEERGAILNALTRLRRHDADLVDPLTSFLPLPSHRVALSRDVVVVLGGRGAGKTALFRLVNDARTAARLRGFFEDDRIPEVTWFDAFSQEGMKHPEVGTLESWAMTASDLSLRAFWMTHLLRRVHEEVPGVAPLPPAIEGVIQAPTADLAAWLPAAEANLGTVSSALDGVERALAAADRTVVATYDNLDRVGQHEAGIRRRYISTLLALWLSLANRYKRLRGKLFLRDDLFDAGEMGFADASKLRARAETIAWDPEALYRVVVRHVAGMSAEMRAWLHFVPGLELRDRGEFGWVPGEMHSDVQRELMTRLAWRVIGKGVLKGETHKWIVNRLQDAHRRVTPRAMLWFFGFAGEEAQSRAAGREKTPLIADDLVEALRRTSRERVIEIKDEYPPAERMENLRGMTIPMDRNEVVKRLGRRIEGEVEAIPEQGEAILGELLRLGVLRLQEDGRLDVPDIFRYTYDITPDYAGAWAGFLGDKQADKEMFIRDLLILREALPAQETQRWLQPVKDALERKDYAEAREQCDKALTLAQSIHNLMFEAQLWFLHGRINYGGERLLPAISDFQRATALARRAKNRSLEIQCHLILASLHEKSNHLEQTAQNLKRALKVAQTEREAAEWENSIFESMALVADNRGQANIAALFLHLGVIVAERANSPSLENLSRKAHQMSLKVDPAPGQPESDRREAERAYKLDEGWGLIHRAFDVGKAAKSR